MLWKRRYIRSSHFSADSGEVEARLHDLGRRLRRLRHLLRDIRLGAAATLGQSRQGRREATRETRLAMRQNCFGDATLTRQPVIFPPRVFHFCANLISFLVFFFLSFSFRSTRPCGNNPSPRSRLDRSSPSLLLSSVGCYCYYRSSRSVISEPRIGNLIWRETIKGKEKKGKKHRRESHVNALER